MHIVAQINNSSLGATIAVEDMEEGKKEVITIAEERLKRKLTDEELETVENTGEFYCEEDADNVWSVSVGIVEGIG